MADTKKNAAPMQIVVDDGSRRVPIMNTNGDEIGVFYFRPTDIGIVERYNSMTEEFDKILEPLADVDVKPDGTADEKNEAQSQALKEAENRLYAAVNKLFDADMASAFFGKMHPFSPVNGVFFCEIALEAVGRYISEQFEQETVRYNKNVDKYVKKYKK